MKAFFRDNGVEIEFVDGSVPNDGPYAAVASILAGVSAGDYRRKMIEATQRGRDARKAEGRFLSRPPFGYSKDSEMRLVIDEDQAQIVKMIFDMCDRERMDLRLIQKRLTGKVPSPSGGLVWHSSGLHKLLTNVVYWSGFHRSGVPAPPIISEEQVELVQDRLANHRLKTGHKTTWALQGRIRCSCGASWKCQSGRGGRAKEEYFCRNRYSNGPRVLRGGDRWDAPRRGKHEFEVAIFNALCDSFQDPDHLAAALEVSLKGARERLESIGADVAPVQEAIADTNRRLANVDRARITDRLADDELDTLEKQLLQRRDELEHTLSAMHPSRLAELEEARAMLPGR